VLDLFLKGFGRPLEIAADPSDILLETGEFPLRESFGRGSLIKLLQVKEF
jgi:hypothetical protein